MKTVIYFVILCFALLLFSAAESFAQCSMCSMSAEASVAGGNTEGKGLNTGILYLLAMPYIAIVAIGFLWYKKYRRKNIQLDIKDDKLNLN